MIFLYFFIFYDDLKNIFFKNKLYNNLFIEYKYNYIKKPFFIYLKVIIYSLVYNFEIIFYIIYLFYINLQYFSIIIN